MRQDKGVVRRGEEDGLAWYSRAGSGLELTGTAPLSNTTAMSISPGWLKMCAEMSSALGWKSAKKQMYGSSTSQLVLKTIVSPRFGCAPVVREYIYLAAAAIITYGAALAEWSDDGPPPELGGFQFAQIRDRQRLLGAGGAIGDASVGRCTKH